MLRSPFPGHRRYSITHRAVQRLRELVPSVAEEDDETLRDRLDVAIVSAEDGGRAVRTLDVMLAEPQILVPLETFGETLYAIIKEETVVTVLPRGHGEEILQRGQALEQRVASGEPAPRPPDREEPWDARRRWRRESPVPVIERVRSHSGETHDDATQAPAKPAPGPAPAPEPRQELTPSAAAVSTLDEPPASRSLGVIVRPVTRPAQRMIAPATASERITNGCKPKNQIAEAIARSLELARRRAATQAVRDALQQQPADAPLLPLWNLFTEKQLPETMTVGDLVAALRSVNH